jgi:signal transduction histidine kinase
MRLRLSLRARIMLLVLGVALVPLGLVGWWLTRTAARSGEALLRARLAEALERTVADVGPRWIPQRAGLLSLAESPEVQHGLSGASGRPLDPPAGLMRLFHSLDPAIERVVVHDDAGAVLWTLERPAPVLGDAASGDAPVPVTIGVFERLTEHRLGALQVELRTASLVEARAGAPSVVGAVLAVVDPSSGASLVSTPFDPSNLRAARFEWAGDTWITEARSIAEPRLDLVAAAPLTPFTQPFEAAARRGLWVLIGAGLTGVLLAALLTARMTRGLRRLAIAAEAVAAGDLSRKVGGEGSDEVGRVARAFNAMTDSLHQTLGALARQESLAAVGQFASELAHEVRNPLTAIRLDLQLVEEQLAAGSPMRALQRGALEEIERLDDTVAGVLQLARSGRVTLQAIDVRPPLREALHAAQPAFERYRVVVRVEAPTPAFVRGDAGGLRQLFLNLLLNAAQALEGGGSVELRVDAEPGAVLVTVTDDGPGIPAAVLALVRDPFFSTRPEGTGLGLAVAERIANAHGSALEFECPAAGGTIVRLRLDAVEAT